MVEFSIETTIDRFINLLRKRKRIKISEAARILKVSQRQVDEWVFTLEDKGIVDLKYPVLGEPEAVIIEETPEQIAAEIKKNIDVDTRIIPGQPIKKKDIPKFKLEKLPESPSYEDNITEQTASSEDYNEIVGELDSLKEKIANIAAKRARDSGPTSSYVNEKLKFLEDKLHQLSKKSKEEDKLYETERVILEKIESLEKRLEEKANKPEEEK